MNKLPNILTFARIILIPLVLATFYIESNAAHWAGCVLFTIAAITDFFDGYLARATNQTSSLGRFLDPIADKLLVSSVILFLAAFDRLGVYGLLPAVVILCREILVSGLREFLAEIRIGMPVSRLAKWKTGFQLVALPVLITGKAGPEFLHTVVLGETLLWIAAILTLITGYDYLKAGLKHMSSDSDK